MRSSLLAEVKRVFQTAKDMVRGTCDPDMWEDEDGRLDALERDVLYVIRENVKLRKAFKAAVRMHEVCPADNDTTHDYWEAVIAFEAARDKVK